MRNWMGMLYTYKLSYDCDAPVQLKYHFECMYIEQAQTKWIYKASDQHRQRDVKLLF